MEVFLSQYFNAIVIVWIGLAILLFPLLLKVRAPYGRHTAGRWGPRLDNRLGWFIMELPSLILITSLFFAGRDPGWNVLWIFWALWFIHYFNRIFIYPFRTRTKGKKIPLLVVLLAMFFNLVNGFLNGYWLGYIAGSREQGAGITSGADLSQTAGADLSQTAGADLSQTAGADLSQTAGADLQIRASNGDYHLLNPHFIIGLALFLTGFIINQVSDNHLLHLRNGRKKGYSIPTHPLFKYVSCPNFAGEILEWTGFAIMTWSLPGLSFAIWTAVNLIPRALHHHAWYKETFPDYPKKRKALIPYIL